MQTGIELIAEERQEQITKHGRTLQHDRAVNNHYQLSQAAAFLCYLDEDDKPEDIESCCPSDWDPIWWAKMMNKPYGDRLIIAGALIAAEIDRLLNVSANEIAPLGDGV